MHDAESIWTQTLALLANELDSETYSAWLTGARPLGVQGSTLLVEIPNQFARDWLEAHYRDHLRTCLAELLGADWRVKFLLPGEQPPLPSHPVSAPAVPPAAGTRLTSLDATAPSPSRRARAPRTPIAAMAESQISSSPAPRSRSAARAAAHVDDLAAALNPRYTFDTFVVGGSNRFAHAACLAVAEDPAHSYNPLFLYGGVGLGKTHLMQAIGHHTLEHHPSLRVVYVTSEKFTNELVNGIQRREMEQFRAKYRTADILLIDDIQFVAGKESTQEEFFHTFNALYEANKQIVISSDRPPKEIPTLEERLRSRFEWGLMADISPPDYETRLAILKRKASMEHIAASNDVIAYLAGQILTNIRELEGALNRVIAYAALTSRPLTVELAAEVLKPMVSATPTRISIASIQKAVADYYGVSLDELRSKRRSRAVAFPRQVAMFLVRELTDASLPQIGAEFGRDHTTVMHACERVETALHEDPSLKTVIESLKEQLRRPVS
ncbi:MAG: chromosomal replication initiator protein DnaA [Limnochordaceae bacterium]|nr:chromosomal replication initiator protein DnaA [Limnochordaceae bacterium]